MSRRRDRKNRTPVRPFPQWVLQGAMCGGGLAIALIVYLAIARSPEPQPPQPDGPLSASVVAAPRVVPPTAEATQSATPSEQRMEPPVASLPPEPSADISGPSPEIPEAASTPQPTKPLATTTSPEPPAQPLLINEAPLKLVGIESSRETAAQRRIDLMQRAADERQWSVYRPLLKKSLDAAFAEIGTGRGTDRFAPIWEEPVFYQTLLQWKTLGQFPPVAITEIIQDSDYADFFIWLLQNNAAMEELLMTIESEDDRVKVLEILRDSWDNERESYEKYFNLTLAFAVVYDQPVQITHNVGLSEEDLEYTPAQMIDPIKRRQWFIEKNEKGKLEAPVDRSSARDLVWVVNAPVATSELEWAIRHMRLRRRSWGNAYGQVNYLMERAVDGINPYDEYSFAEIEDEGGICGDQTYFCINTARANGIPAIGLSGETNRGPHAWAAIKIKPDEWTTKVGRINGASRAQARNPQTGKTITEQEIELWNDRDHQSESTTLAVHRHLWLADYLAETDHKEARSTAVMVANKIGETFPESWQGIYQMLESETVLSGDPEKPENLDAWEDFVENMRREFKENPRFTELASQAEIKFIIPYIPLSEARRALHRERRRIERYSGEQVDLIANSLKREADLIAGHDEIDADREISQLYDKALKDYGSNVTGFRNMAEDYFNFFRDNKEMSPKVARDIELAYKRVLESGDKEYFRAQTEAELLKMICEFYRAAGEEKRAELLEKRAERNSRRAKRGAS